MFYSHLNLKPFVYLAELLIWEEKGRQKLECLQMLYFVGNVLVISTLLNLMHNKLMIQKKKKNHKEIRTIKMQKLACKTMQNKNPLYFIVYD